VNRRWGDAKSSGSGVNRRWGDAKSSGSGVNRCVTLTTRQRKTLRKRARDARSKAAGAAERDESFCAETSPSNAEGGGEGDPAPQGGSSVQASPSEGGAALGFTHVRALLDGQLVASAAGGRMLAACSALVGLHPDQATEAILVSACVRYK
jgi:hypothetical protein